MRGKRDLRLVECVVLLWIRTLQLCEMLPYS